MRQKIRPSKPTMRMPLRRFFAILVCALCGWNYGEALSVVPTMQTNSCVIVGGGPVGLATALMLKTRHQLNVTVLERTAGASSIRTYDPTKSYLYNVNPRGVEFFTTIVEENGLDQLEENGYAFRGFGNICRVPADPHRPIEEPDPVTISGRAKLANDTSYWIPRHTMVALLMENCEKENIPVLDNKQVETLTTQADHQLTVSCRDGTSYTGSLVVAADGFKSTIRDILHETGDGWLHSFHKAFKVIHKKSASTGNKLKALQFPPNFTLPNTDGSIITSQSGTIYTIRSKHNGSRNRLSLGLLPLRDPNMVRPANTNTPYDHEIWSLQTGAQAKAWFTEAFPRVPWDTLVDDSEWERFAKAEGTVFPDCQYSKGSMVASPSRKTGVVLVGDACHAFPPDIGQGTFRLSRIVIIVYAFYWARLTFPSLCFCKTGINAGLQDVLALHRALSGVNLNTKEQGIVPETLGDALETYQSNRKHEHKALFRLALHGAPYQYNQPWKRHRVGKFLWTCNFMVRLLLHKVFRLPPQSMMILQDAKKSYRQVMQRADITTWTLKFVLLAVFAKIWGPAIAGNWKRLTAGML